MMKKALTLVLSIVLALSLGACQSKVTPQDKQTVGGTVSQTTSSGESSGTAQPEEWKSGKTAGDVYTSEFAGFKLTAPDHGWSFADEEYILGMMNIAVNGTDILTDEQKKAAALAEQTTIYDAMLSDSTTGSNIMVMYENLQATNAWLLNAQGYADALKQQLVITGSYTVSELSTVTMAGASYVRMDCSATVENVTVKQSYFIRKIGKFMLVICMTGGAGGGAAVEDMMTMFSAI